MSESINLVAASSRTSLLNANLVDSLIFEILSSTTMRPTSRLWRVVPKSSYYGRDYRAEAALIRARQPYLIKNIVTGLCLTSLTIGIYVFTFYAIKQDDFSDVPIPDAPAPAPAAPHATVNKSAGPATPST